MVPKSSMSSLDASVTCGWVVAGLLWRRDRCTFQPSGRAVSFAIPKSELVARLVGQDTAGMRTYGQYCPIARISELLAERWTPIIIRNLLAGCRTCGEQ